MKVAHFVRKNGQLQASFILNQILNHVDFEPFIVCRFNDKSGGFAKFSNESIKKLELYKEKKINLDLKYLFKISNNDIKKIIRFINDNNITINHFHYGSDAFIYSEVIKNAKQPSVVSFYGYDCSTYPDNFFGYGKWCLNNYVFKYADRILAMSPDMKNDLIKIGCPENKIIIHYHGSDTSKFNFKRNYYNKEKLTILILCSLVQKKGHIFLLKSVKKLLDNNIHNFNLRIVGTGELEKDLKQFVNKMNLNNYVSFVGAVGYDSKEMHNEYENADIFVHPSVVAPNGAKEGIPGTIVEAMSSGLPVISTYHAGIPYIIDNEKTGFLVKEHDVNDLAEKIKNLIENNDLRAKIGSAGQKFAIENLDLKLKEKELEKIYLDLIEEKNNGK